MIRRGFTIIETLVAIAASSVLVAGVGLAFSMTARTFSVIADTGSSDREAASSTAWWLEAARYADELSLTSKSEAHATKTPISPEMASEQHALAWAGVAGAQAAASTKTGLTAPAGAFQSLEFARITQKFTGTGFSTITPIRSELRASLSLQAGNKRYTYDNVIFTQSQSDDLFISEGIDLSTLPAGWALTSLSRRSILLKGPSTKEDLKFSFWIDAIGKYEIAYTFLDGTDAVQSGSIQ